MEDTWGTSPMMMGVGIGDLRVDMQPSCSAIQQDMGRDLNMPHHHPTAMQEQHPQNIQQELNMQDLDQDLAQGGPRNMGHHDMAHHHQDPMGHNDYYGNQASGSVLIE